MWKKEIKNSTGLHTACIDNINLCKQCKIQALKNNWETIKKILKFN